MRRFAALYRSLEAGPGGERLAAMTEHFRASDDADVGWGAFLLSGRGAKRIVRPVDLRRWALEAAGLPEWLFDASQQATGDVAETAALLVPAGTEEDTRSLEAWLREEVLPLQRVSPIEQRERVVASWRRLDAPGRLVLNKVLIGAFRPGVKEPLVHRALADALGLPPDRVAERLAGDWFPTPDFIAELRGGAHGRTPSHPPAPVTGPPHPPTRVAGPSHVVRAVMIYAQASRGRHASLYTDYTFAVWQGDELVPFARTAAGVDTDASRELDDWIRRHTVERFGPARRVEPSLVFEVAFEGVERSRRHRSGIVVRAPRIVRWRRDLDPHRADTLATLKAMIGEGQADVARRSPQKPL